MKKKREYPNDFKTIFGVAIMGMLSVAASTLMQTMFMSYLTDYAGIGAWGATLGTVLLLVGRIVDIINDPLQGWIMDNAKTTKWGKYKKFCIWSIILTAVSVILLYNIPSGILSQPWLVALWTTLFYLGYDFGGSFYALSPLVQSLTDNEVTRSKLFAWNRIVGTFIAIPMGFFLTTALMLNRQINNLHDSIGIMAFVWIVPVMIISLIGTFLIKEGKHYEEKEDNKQSKVTWKDIVEMFKRNNAMRVHFFASLFSGFMWTLIFATEAYYIKWAYCADITTGVVDESALGMYTAVGGMLQIIPIIVAAGVAPSIIKKLGSAIRTMKLSYWISLVPGFILFGLQLTGILVNNSGLYLGLLAVQAFGIGLGFVPGNTIWLECIDYNAYKTGKEMGGLINSIRSILDKLHTALAGAVVGVILMAIGYNVDSVTHEYVGNLSALPTMLDWFIVVAGLVPSLLAIIAIVIYRYYPITPEVRAEMKAVIGVGKR